jgi:hypothetical protein
METRDTIINTTHWAQKATGNILQTAVTRAPVPRQAKKKPPGVSISKTNKIIEPVIHTDQCIENLHTKCKM